MNFLRAWLEWWNPTWYWQADSTPQVVDLDQHRFAGCGIGDPLRSLAFLGRGQPQRDEVIFPRQGVVVGLDDRHTIRDLAFFFGHPDEPQNGSFLGSFRYQQQLLPIDQARTIFDFVTMFGEPYWRDQDATETILFYEFPDREWQCEFSNAGGLKCWVIGKPLLADAEQRRAYRVTRAWPPTFTADRHRHS